MSDLLALERVSTKRARGAFPGQALADLSLRVHAGEIVAVVGVQGAGKSTLLRLAAGMQTPDSGAVWLGDLELSGLLGRERERLLGREIAWTDRERPRLPWKIHDYVGLPLALGRRRGCREARALAVAALSRVGIAGCAEKRWEELSHWERVLVCFARGIACVPRLMVMEEPLDGLGRHKRQEAGDLLRALVAELGCGVLMSASDLEAALVADRVMQLERDGGLRTVSDQRLADAVVIDFPGDRRGQGSRSVGA